MKNPFRYFNSPPEIIRLTVMMYVRYPLSLRQVEYLLFDRLLSLNGTSQPCIAYAMNSGPLSETL